MKLRYVFFFVVVLLHVFFIQAGDDALQNFASNLVVSQIIGKKRSLDKSPNDQGSMNTFVSNKVPRADQASVSAFISNKTASTNSNQKNEIKPKFQNNFIRSQVKEALAGIIDYIPDVDKEKEFESKNLELTPGEIASKAYQDALNKGISKEKASEIRKSIYDKAYNAQNKSTILAKRKQYYQSDERKAVQKKYNQSDKAKATRKKYKQSYAGKAVEKKYRQSDKAKALQKKYYENRKANLVARSLTENQQNYKFHKNSELSDAFFDQSNDGIDKLPSTFVLSKISGQKRSFDKSMNDQPSVTTFMSNKIAPKIQYNFIRSQVKEVLDEVIDHIAGCDKEKESDFRYLKLTPAEIAAQAYQKV